MPVLGRGDGEAADERQDNFHLVPCLEYCADLSENGAELEQDSKLATEDYEGMRVATFGKTELQDVVFPRVSHVSYSDMVQNVLLLLVICVSSNVDSSIFVELLRLLLQMRV